MPKKKQRKFNLYWIALISALILGVIGVLIVSPPQWGWLGIGESQEVSQVTKETIDPKTKEKIVTTTKREQAKTLWDWLGLLGVPVSLAVLAWWLQQLQQEQTAANQREEILQTYFDRVSTLLVDENLLAISTKVENATRTKPKQQDEAISEEEELLNVAMDVIRARTLSILRRLENDPKRKTSIIQFLFESGVIHKLNLDLSHADLHGINLFDVTLNTINLSDINLSHANLSDAQLHGVILKNADLTGTDFTGANLEGADLRAAELMGVNFSNANLVGANLSSTHFLGADFKDADLRDANLEGADFEYAQFDGANLNQAQLKGADFRDAKKLKLRQIKLAKNWQEADYGTNLQEQVNLLLKSQTPPDNSDDCPF